MKLYTEEQVDIMLSRARMQKQDDTYMFTNEYLLSQETPIELPSDEKIEESSFKMSGNNVSSSYNANATKSDLEILQDEVKSLSNLVDGYIYCGKWMKEQIINQKK